MHISYKEKSVVEMYLSMYLDFKQCFCQQERKFGLISFSGKSFRMCQDSPTSDYLITFSATPKKKSLYKYEHFSLLFLQQPKRKVYTNMNIFLYFFCNTQKEKFIQIWTYFSTFSGTYKHIFKLFLLHTSIKVYVNMNIINLPNLSWHNMSAWFTHNWFHSSFPQIQDIFSSLVPP